MELWRKKLIENRPISSYVYSEEEWYDIVINELMGDPTKGGTWGIKHTKETKQLMANAKTGKNRSKESCFKQSKSTSGKLNHFYGKSHSEETKEKMSRKKLGLYDGGKSNTAIKIKVIDNNGEYYFDCLKDYSKFSGIKYGNITNLFRKQRKDQTFRSSGQLKDILITECIG